MVPTVYMQQNTAGLESKELAPHCSRLKNAYRLYAFFQLFAKLQATKQDIVDLQEEHIHERQELEQTQNELMRELKLKSVLHCTCIPAKVLTCDELPPWPAFGITGPCCFQDADY